MAHTFPNKLAGNIAGFPAPDTKAEVTGRSVFFRALVDLDTGSVAGIEAAQHGVPRLDTVFPYITMGQPLASGPDSLGAWGSELREPAAYLVRGDLNMPAGRSGASCGVAPGRVIFMFDVTALLQEPARSLEKLLAIKQGGARILLDNFDLEDPPARFMELLPADILRMDPRRMPWHWDDARRQDTMASLLRFADNLLMDVAVEGVESGGQRRELKRLGVRYGQGGWRRDTLGLVPNPGCW